MEREKRLNRSIFYIYCNCPDPKPLHHTLDDVAAATAFDTFPYPQCEEQDHVIF